MWGGGGGGWGTYDTRNVLSKASKYFFVVAEFIGLSIVFLDLPCISDPAFWSCVSCVCFYCSLFDTYFFLSFLYMHVLELLLTSLNTTSLVPLLDHIL